jgi:hypothetical protein
MQLKRNRANENESKGESWLQKYKLGNFTRKNKLQKLRSIVRLPSQVPFITVNVDVF